MRVARCAPVPRSAAARSSAAAGARSSARIRLKNGHASVGRHVAERLGHARPSRRASPAAVDLLEPVDAASRPDALQRDDGADRDEGVVVAGEDLEAGRERASCGSRLRGLEALRVLEERLRRARRGAAQAGPGIGERLADAPRDRPARAARPAGSRAARLGAIREQPRRARRARRAARSSAMANVTARSSTAPNATAVVAAATSACTSAAAQGAGLLVLAAQVLEAIERLGARGVVGEIVEGVARWRP